MLFSYVGYDLVLLVQMFDTTSVEEDLEAEPVVEDLLRRRRVSDPSPSLLKIITRY